MGAIGKFLAVFLFLLPMVCLADETVELDADAEVAPLAVHLSAAEKQQENSSDLSYIEEETQLPDLACNDAKLLRQIKKYIYAGISENPTNSVRTKRERVLLIKNLHEFSEITEADITGKNNFIVRAALLNMRINQKLHIEHICVSQNNNSQKFSNVYAVIYRSFGYYKVLIANLLDNPEETDNATFVYNW